MEKGAGRKPGHVGVEVVFAVLLRALSSDIGFTIVEKLLGQPDG